ncbi:hypothetical protein AArc1_3373 [Natrarchaeobaculum sulfurireducens]|uniref:Uncharacterized protein n=1 Tax=Natrarchaeobaculum sulfurireducens TaxID=2044521 RepID=A0A346PJH6_9EURY|nr:hypothetical protein AArc1_3373 [Natrarchaeobaculum sulfurireducens]
MSPRERPNALVLEREGLWTDQPTLGSYGDVSDIVLDITFRMHNSGGLLGSVGTVAGLT